MSEQKPVAWMTANDWGKEPLVTSNPMVVSAWQADSRAVTPLYADALPEQRASDREVLNRIQIFFGCYLDMDKSSSWYETARKDHVALCKMLDESRVTASITTGERP